MQDPVVLVQVADSRFHRREVGWGEVTPSPRVGVSTYFLVNVLSKTALKRRKLDHPRCIVNGVFLVWFLSFSRDFQYQILIKYLIPMERQQPGFGSHEYDVTSVAAHVRDFTDICGSNLQHHLISREAINITRSKIWKRITWGSNPIPWNQNRINNPHFHEFLVISYSDLKTCKVNNRHLHAYILIRCKYNSFTFVFNFYFDVSFFQTTTKGKNSTPVLLPTHNLVFLSSSALRTQTCG